MDRRGWPWKKKSSDKVTKTDKPFEAHDSVDSTLSSVAHLGNQENCANKNYVQIPMDSYTCMTGLEDQVKDLESKLSAAYSELDNKENLVKQHAKVAEEAVSGWEKADAEVVSLRSQLESITLSKRSCDERVTHLDGALKECVKQIRTIKEENEKKIQEVILMKSQQWERFKLELESEIDKLDKGLREEASENAALLRSLHESSNKIVKLKEEKSEVEAELELQKKNVQSYEKEVNSLKYELHIVSKEMDIRNEEKNMIMKSAEVANKRHSEDVKTIARLEGECQRLRGLLRKKLPGPAALAQMKLEVESTHRVISGIHQRKSSNQQESEFLSVLKRFEVFEEETTRLKEALASSNAELQASRNLYTKTVGRVKSLEAEVQILHQERSSQTQKSNLELNYRNSSSRISSNSPSITSISDSWHEDPESPVESFAASVSGHFEVSRVRSSVKYENRKSEAISELMDDFLEMEKMACSSDNDSVQIANKVKNDSEDNQLKSNDALVEIQLKCMTESYKSLQTHVEELEAENKRLKEKIDELKNDLEEEKHCHHNALARHKELEEKMQRDKCLECTSNSAAKKDIDTRKDAELAAAEKKLAQCQETLHVLGRQLQAMCPQIGSKRLQTNESSIIPNYDWSNSNGSYNSDEIDHAEACSLSSNSDIQGANDEFSSSRNFSSTSCLSDTECNRSVNSSIVSEGSHR
ncbi:filament-like plant protein 4 isoform X2 [Vicia villosa]|uniref:filament-like plant protein 4 isoform X2 n=1 Tax=Vicia villosa TaxID=3911 RepID=UPI00273AF11D|nr:filament-like plant protein 4 isoform X2 [Vicia villosa]